VFEVKSIQAAKSKSSSWPRKTSSCELWPICQALPVWKFGKQELLLTYKMQYVLHWPPSFPACKLNPEGGPLLGLQLYFKLLNVSCILFTRKVLQIFLPVWNSLQSLKLATKTTSVSCCESLYIKLFYWKLSGRKQGNPWLPLTFRNGPKLAVWMRKSRLLECTR